ncbi:AAA family ATPase [Desulfosediminicola flagellatus]|uniref:cytidylate kinase-like family protein n=1 Tax=Desulfosediminicola flagellatus TaxID=2569541 RepID=UPI0010ABF10D|nr:cytidylate kinase-like family protein [Desulfosediminicola flagellatus]
MSIVTISRGSYSRGKEVAEKLAQKLNYECTSRDILLEACSEFNIPEVKLVRALHDAPSVLERFQHGKERFLSYYRYIILKHMKKDNIVYHGLAGHYILRDIPHVLKVRIIANMEDRVLEEMKRENISADNALYILKKDDDERRKWGLHVHGTDTWDSRLYDMVLHISTLTVDDAVQILFETVQKPIFQATPESSAILDNMLKAARLHSRMVDRFPHAVVVVKEGIAHISNVGIDLKTESYEMERIEGYAKDIEGVTSVVVDQPVPTKGSYINPYHNI